MFAEIFNDLLAERGLNRKQFSEQSGIPYTTVIGWTNLNRLPDYSALIKIADFFECSIDYLTERQECNAYGTESWSKQKRSGYSSTYIPLEEQQLIQNYRKLSNKNKQLLLSISSALSIKDNE